MSAFFDMGGYGAFVWPAYGITALVLGFLVIRGFSRISTVQAQLRALDPSAETN
jgi:heme exporter protein CcmD